MSDFTVTCHWPGFLAAFGAFLVGIWVGTERPLIAERPKLLV